MAEQRLAVVTGAARGIGRAIVLELLKQGRKVAGLDLNAEQLKELEKAVQEAGFSVITKVVDITKTDVLTKILEELAEEHGGIGILVNNAGITRDRLMIQMDDEDFDKVMAVNLRAAFTAPGGGSFYDSQQIWPDHQYQFGRRRMGQAGSANYAASKAGLIE